MKNLIFVTYDGIQNSVFSGQVIQPLLNKINNNPAVKVYIVSFEKNYLSQEIIAKYIPQNKNLVLVHFRRLPVLGKISLYPSVYYLKKFLKQFDNYEIISRGPIAGWVTNKAINKKCMSHILQARGLLAAEYEFSHLPHLSIHPSSLSELRRALEMPITIFKQLWHTWRTKTLFDIEKEVYSRHPECFYTSQNVSRDNHIIKPVSSALADYLIETYKADPRKIIIEMDDIPKLIPEEQKKVWRQSIRKKLNIADNAQIYCYNGAVKAWQCPELVINFFWEQLEKDENAFLLILSQDKEEFIKMVFKSKIPEKNYHVISLQHEQIYEYLSACDYGLMFRKSNHIVNWVSRPVKAMEYKAAGLKIIHNNTVKWLIE